MNSSPSRMRVHLHPSAFDALDEKFETRFDTLSTQIKFIFAALAALLALGLVDTVQRLIG